MRKAFIAIFAMATLALAGCGGDNGGGGGGDATITMGSGVFTGNTNITIKAGQLVKLDDSSGGIHNLVIGTGGNPEQEAGAPSELSSGIMFNGGDSKTVTFPNAGTFHITCTIHSGMQATVTVTS